MERRMKKRFVKIYLLCVLASLSSDLAAVPNTTTPTTFLGPTIKLGLASSFPDMFAYSVAAEAGYRNVQLDGTVGFQLFDEQRFKLSLAYLLQNINYSYFSSNTSQWVQQGTIGGNYQYDLGKYLYLYHPELDVGFYYSHAPSKSLRIEKGTFLNQAGILTPFTDNKRIAGSNAAGINPGVTLTPWEGGTASFHLHYDDVHYDTIYESGQNPRGLGATFSLDQMIEPHVVVGAIASARQPFYHYQAHLTWVNVPYYGAWTMGFLAAYTVGKNNLPNTYNLGVNINYLLDNSPSSSIAEKEEALAFLNWTAISSASLPQVLAMPDEKVTT